MFKMQKLLAYTYVSHEQSETSCQFID